MNEGCAEELMELLCSDTDERSRYGAALDLARFSREDVVYCLAQRLPTESRPVQEAIVSSLIGIGTEAVADCCANLLDCDDAYVRNAALEVLQALDRKSLKVAARLLAEADARLRLFGVQVLSEMRCREAAELLRQTVERDQDVNVVAAAVESLGEMGLRHEDREAVTTAATRFANPFLSYAAETALKKMGCL